LFDAVDKPPQTRHIWGFFCRTPSRYPESLRIERVPALASVLSRPATRCLTPWTTCCRSRNFHRPSPDLANSSLARWQRIPVRFIYGRATFAVFDGIRVGVHAHWVQKVQHRKAARYEWCPHVLHALAGRCGDHCRYCPCWPCEGSRHPICGRSLLVSLAPVLASFGRGASICPRRRRLSAVLVVISKTRAGCGRDGVHRIGRQLYLPPAALAL
jgi:hypothetical protein